MEHFKSDDVELKILKKRDIEKIEKDSNQKKEIQEIISKKDIINSLILDNIDGLDTYLDSIDSFPKLNYVNISSAQLKKKYYELNLNKLFPNASEIYIHNTLVNLINLEKYNYNIINKKIDYLAFPFHLTKLYLTKMEIINLDFKNIFDQILSTPELVKNIKELSFAKNLISKIDLNEILYSPKHKFVQLEFLDFRKNRLSKFTYNPSYMEKIHTIDLSNNLFAKNPFEGYKNLNIFILLSGNTYLTETKLCKQYSEELINNLKTFSFSMNYLNMKGISTRYNKEIFNDITINPNLANSLRKLNLSYCYLDNEGFFKFFDNNKFENLESLILTGGDINDDFFKIYLEKQLNESIKKLRSLNLSNNNIRLDNFQILYDFILENKKLSKLDLCKNPFAKEKGFSVISKKQIKNAPKLETTNGLINIKDFNSFINKLNKELVIESKERNGFSLKFDCGSVNNNISSSQAFVKGEKLVIVKK